MSDDFLDKKGIRANEAPERASAVSKDGWGVTGALFLGTCAFLLPQVALVPVVPIVEKWALGENMTSFIYALIFELLTILLVVTFTYAYGHRLPQIGLGRFRPSYLGLAALGFGAYFLVSIVTSTLFGLFVNYDQDQVQELGFNAPVGFEAALIFVALVVLAPLAEEILFRGFVFSGVRRRLGFGLTATIVSLLFALVHFQLNVALDVFALSLVLCYLREKTGSLWPGIVLHATKNAVAFILLFMVGGFG